MHRNAGKTGGRGVISGPERDSYFVKKLAVLGRSACNVKESGAGKGAQQKHRRRGGKPLNRFYPVCPLMAPPPAGGQLDRLLHVIYSSQSSGTRRKRCEKYAFDSPLPVCGSDSKVMRTGESAAAMSSVL